MNRGCLELVLQLHEGKSVELARLCAERMRPSEWQLLREFAAEVTSLGESMAAGTRILVVPAAELGQAVEALGLKVAGQA
jgi:hypothetical protein